MIYNRIRFRHLHCFLAIAEHHSVGAAAGALAITQPALSKTLRELEDELGVQLFERGRRGMTLSRFGDIFLQHATASIASLRHGLDSIDIARAAGEHTVAVGTLPNVSGRLIPQAVKILKQDAAGTLVRVVESRTYSRALDQLRRGELDLVVGRLAKSEHMTGLSFDHLYSEPLSIVVRRKHPLAAARRFKLPMIADYPWMLPDQGTIIRQEIDRFLLGESIGASADIIETTSVPFARAYVESGDIVWFVPRGVVQTDIDDGRLVALTAPPSALEGPVGITTRADMLPTPAGRLLIDAVRRAARQLAAADQ
ncbi:MAG TPA: pca operon transcription factor PcaQ [Pseudolabrys sp.]|nr:pca operon transcription factor PcaQ [Pseudolabrys sp.]